MMNPSNCKQQQVKAPVSSVHHDLDLEKLSLEPSPGGPWRNRANLYYITQLIANGKWGELNSFLRSHDSEISQESTQMNLEENSEEHIVPPMYIGK